MEEKRANIIFIFADQLRGSSLGFIGEEDVITPNFNKFAMENSYFKTSVSMFPVCTPYRGCLITGKSPTSTGLVLNDIPLSTNEISIAHACKEAGYQTAYIGKWHLNGPDRKTWIPSGKQRFGFDYWAAANFDHNYDNSKYFEQDSDAEKKWEGYDAESQTDNAIKYLQDRNKSKPTCLFLSWGPPHHPYRTVDKKYLDMYDPDKLTIRANCPDVPKEDLQGYYAQITFLDEQFGKLMKAIEDMGIKDNTIIAFSSDHGDMLGSHGVYKKQWPWDECIKTPFLLSYPKAIKPGSIFRFPINVIDIMPTLLGLAKIDIPSSVEGVDLSPFITGEKDNAPESVLFTNPCSFEIGDPRGDDQYPTFKGRKMEYRGVRTDRYTYVRTIEGAWLLYDNIIDPYQLNNLIDKPEMKEIQDKLEKMLVEHLKKLGDDIHPNEYYYEKYNLNIDHRGKIAEIIENPYNRLG